jgi:hypothetical protein
MIVVEGDHREHLAAAINRRHEREVDAQRGSRERHPGERVGLGSRERLERRLREQSLDREATSKPVGVEVFDVEGGPRIHRHADPDHGSFTDARTLPGAAKVTQVVAAGEDDDQDERGPAHGLDGSTRWEQCATFTEMRFLMVVLVALAATPAFADDPPPASTPDPDDLQRSSLPPVPPIADPPPPAEDRTLHADNEFGPVIQIEEIDVAGNTATQTELIRRTLPLGPGDVLHASDKRLREARFKVLALGFFRDVTLSMRKGSQRGLVILEVRVVERGTVVLNRLWFGTTSVSPWWVGADVGERNLLGLGIAVGGGFIYAAHGDVDGSRDQWAGELRASDPSLLGTRFGANAALTLVHGSEVYQVMGDPADPAASDLRAFPYRRFGARVGLTYDVNALSRLSAGIRAEEIATTLPTAPTQVRPDGRTVALDLHLDPGSSRVVTAGIAFDRDTRPDPILPHTGGHIQLSAELGSSLIGGNYEYATLFGRYEHYWPLLRARHTIGLKLAGGVVIGGAPRFDRIHIADVDRMLTPRALGLVLSAAAPLDILGTRRDKPTYGDLGGSATLEYAFEVFRGTGKNRVYGGDLFLGAGLWGLGETADLRARDTSLADALPIDAYLDAGIRIDTDVGVFEITIANALGRLR